MYKHRMLEEISDTELLKELEKFDKCWKLDSRTGCWLWMGGGRRKHIPGTYGNYSFGARTYRAHRASFILRKGPIPSELTLDHLCNTQECVNPAHLEPVTIAVNIKRRWIRERSSK